METNLYMILIIKTGKDLLKKIMATEIKKLNDYTLYD
jgi:hypothetical protein